MSPFKSEKQKRFLYANKPDLAAEFQRAEDRLRHSGKKKKEGNKK